MVLISWLDTTYYIFGSYFIVKIISFDKFDGWQVPNAAKIIMHLFTDGECFQIGENW